MNQKNKPYKKRFSYIIDLEQTKDNNFILTSPDPRISGRTVLLWEDRFTLVVDIKIDNKGQIIEKPPQVLNDLELLKHQLEEEKERAKDFQQKYWDKLSDATTLRLELKVTELEEEIKRLSEKP